MTQHIISALLIYAFVTSVTPGPNNLMLMASGANFGFRRTIPHMLGVGLGFGLMVFLVGVGLAGLFHALPYSDIVLKALSLAYMVYLSWKIATSGEMGEGDAEARPMTFVQAAAFQWVNPKAWSMALASVSLYAIGGTLTSVLIVAIVFMLVNLPSVGVWVVAGTQVKRFLNNPARMRAFNITMAVLLLLSIAPVLMH